MNLASYLANKCFEFLLSCDAEKDGNHYLAPRQVTSGSSIKKLRIILPPWAHEAELFKSTCDGCGECVTSCENEILIPGSNGYPRIDFSRGSCSFCGACAESCPRDVFGYEPSAPPWNLKASITGDCLSHNNVLCRTCVEHCDEEAIIFPHKNGTISAPLVLAERCNGCGACYSPCPAQAVEIGEGAGQEKILTGEEAG